MKEFIVKNQTFVKSKNNTSKILNRYTYALVIFSVLTILYNLIFNNIEYGISVFKSILLSFMLTYIVDYFLNLVNKKYELKILFTEDNIIPISIIIGLFGINTNILVISISILITLIMKRLSKNIGISSSLYGILIIILYKYFQNDLITPRTNLKELGYINSYQSIVKSNGTLIEYLFGKNYLSPVLSIIMFIYLFYKKSIKYNLVISYIGTFSLLMLIIGLIFKMNIWYCFFHLTTGNILFLSIFALTDYKITPEISYGQVVYGIILGTITVFLRFIIPELSVVSALILGPLLLTNPIDNLCIKRISKKI